MTLHSYENAILELDERGLPKTAIAEELGYALSTVEGVLRRMNSDDLGSRNARTRRGSKQLFDAIATHHPGMVA